MNQITIETTTIEAEVSELQALVAKQMEDAVTELNSFQLALVGGGQGTIIL